VSIFVNGARLYVPCNIYISTWGPCEGSYRQSPRRPRHEVDISDFAARRLTQTLKTVGNRSLECKGDAGPSIIQGQEYLS